MGKNDVIIIEIWEGLGNQLFQYSYARLLKAKGLDVRLDFNKTYDDFFEKYKLNVSRQNRIQNLNITLPEIDVRAYKKYAYIERNNIWNRIVFFLAEHGLWKYKFYEEPLSLPVEKYPCFRGNYYIKAWFQNEKYLRKIRGILLKELTPKKKIRISHEVRRALEYEETVSLHIRRGDYVGSVKMLPIVYFKKAAALMKEKYQKPLFLIFSEDIEWVKKNLDIGSHCLYINEDGKLQDYEELFIMSRCKSNIISNSTFSWWGAWLNRNPEKIVIAPKQKWSPKQINIILEGWHMV